MLWKRVERDAERKQQRERGPMSVDAEERQAGEGVVEEEVAVLEQRQHRQVAHDAEQDEPLAPDLVAGPRDRACDEEVDEPGREQDRHEPVIEAGVEEDASERDQPQLAVVAAQHEVEQHEEDREEQDERRAIEQHVPGSSRWREVAPSVILDRGARPTLPQRRRPRDRCGLKRSERPCSRSS